MARALAWLRRQAADVLGALRSRGGILGAIAALAALYVVGLVVPQRSALDPATWEGWRAARPRLVAVLEWTGATDAYRSPAMAVALGVFFLSLAAVLWDRVPRLWRRTRLEAGIPLEAGALARRRGTRVVPVADLAAALGRAAGLLGARGYAVHRAGPGAVRGVRFRYAPLGFLLFHGSFGLLLVGGMLLDATRYAAVTRLAVGESFRTDRAAASAEQLHVPRGRSVPSLGFQVLSMDVAMHPSGRPLRIEADLLFAGEARPDRAAVNAPATRGSASVLVMDVGPAPLLTCTAPGGGADGAWVKLSLEGDRTTRLRFEGCGLDVIARPAEAGTGPVPTGGGVMQAAAAASSPLLDRGLEVVLRGPDGRKTTKVLRVGDGVSAPDGRRLELSDLRPFGVFQIVDEQGGGLLWAGFLVGTAGLLARLVLFRREIVVVADAPAGAVLVAEASDGVVLGAQQHLTAALEQALAGGTERSDAA